MLLRILLLFTLTSIVYQQANACHKGCCKKPKLCRSRGQKSCGGGGACPSPCGGGGGMQYGGASPIYVSEDMGPLSGGYGMSSGSNGISSGGYGVPSGGYGISSGGNGGETFTYAGEIGQGGSYSSGAHIQEGSSGAIYTPGDNGGQTYQGEPGIGTWSADAVTSQHIEASQPDYVNVPESGPIASTGGGDHNQVFHLVPIDATNLDLTNLMIQSPVELSGRNVQEVGFDTGNQAEVDAILAQLNQEESSVSADFPEPARAPSPPPSLPEIPSNLPVPQGPNDPLPAELEEILRLQGPPPQISGIPEGARNFQGGFPRADQYNRNRGNFQGGFPMADGNNRDRGRLRDGLRKRLAFLRANRFSK